MIGAGTRQQCGLALLPVVLAISVLALAVLLLATETGIEASMAGSEHAQQRAYYIAEAGVAHARQMLSQNLTCTGYVDIPVTGFAGGDYAVTVTPTSGAPVTLTAVATLADGTMRTMTAPDQMPTSGPQQITLQPPPSELSDTYTWDGAHKDKNFGTSDILSVNKASAERTTLLRFDLSGFPSGATVSAATLRLYLQGGASLSGALDLHRVTRNWYEGVDNDATPSAPGATYNDWDGTSAWTTTGGDYASPPVDSRSFSGLTPGWVEWDVTSLAAGWISGSIVNDGALIRSDSSGVDKIEFRSADHTDTATRPMLRLTMSCPCGVQCGAIAAVDVLLVVNDESALRTQEDKKKILLETWGYTVNIIDQDSSQAQYDTAVAVNGVVYITEDVSSGSVDTKLVDAPIGVVTEEPNLVDEFGLADDISWGSGTDVDIVDNSHYITQPFAPGLRSILASSSSLADVTGSQAPDLQVLARVASGPAIVAIESGATIIGGGAAAGRRVFLPWGGNDFDVDDLNADGLAILHRSIEWGVGTVLAPGNDPLILSTDSNATLGGLSFENIDLARFDPPATTATLYLDGSAVALASQIDALHVLANDRLILSTKTAAVLGGLAFDADDLIEYDPLTATASMFVDADEHFATTGNVSSVYLDADGGLVLSVDGGVQVDGQSFGGDDLFRYDAQTGSASLFFNGSAVGLNGNIRAAHVLDNGHITLAMDANATLGGLAFGTDQLVDYDPVAGTASLRFDGESLFDDSTEEILSVHIGPGSGQRVGGTLPIAYWKLDETSGGTAVDAVGSHDGSLSGPQWVTGYLDGGADFDGTNDFISVPHTGTLTLLDELTVMAWVNPESIGGSYRTILSKDDGGAGSNYWFGVWQGEIAFGFFSGGTFRESFTTGLGLQAGAWHHLAASFDNAGNDVILYHDGVEVHRGSITQPPAAVTAAVRIGRSPDGEFWQGMLDDVRLFNTALDATDIARIASQPGGGGGGGCDGNFLDRFDAVSYANDDGSLSWSTDWSETGETTSPTGGDMRVVNDTGNYQLRLKDDDRGIWRAADLSPYAEAVLKFKYRRSDDVDTSSDYVTVDISDNGGSSWTELDRIAGPQWDQSYENADHDIRVFMSNDTRIRFLTSGSLGGGDKIFFDDIEITVSGCAGN